MLPMTTTTIPGTWTREIADRLAAIGFVSESRGGDPLRSTWRKPGGRRTALAILVSRKDGAPLTAADKRTIATALAK